MAYNIRDHFQAEVDLRLKGLEADLADADKQKAIEQALDGYSKVKPDTAVADVDGTAGFDYELNTTNFSGWVDGFSVFIEIEYPYDADQATPVFLEAEDWIIYQGTAAKYLRFITAKPAADETIRAHYTIPYAFEDQQVTVPESDYYAICDLAAALALRPIAAKFTQTGDSTLQADVVDYRSKGREALKLMEQYLKDYNSHMGIQEGTRFASLSADQDTEYAIGVDWLTHPRRLY